MTPLELSLLAQADLFRGLPTDELPPIVARAHRLKLRPGERVQSPWEVQDSIFVLTAGAVRVLLASPEGRELTLSRREPVDTFELQVISDELCSDLQAEALARGAVVYVFRWPHLLDLMAFRPQLAVSLAELMRQGLMRDRRLINELAFFSIRRRLAHRLAELAREGNGVIVEISREALAAKVACRPEEVSRALRQLLEEGLVEYRPHQRRIRILYLDELARY